MKVYFVLFALVFSIHCNGQYNLQYQAIVDYSTNPFQYGNNISFVSENVSSDFGCRYLSFNVPFNWHDGIDYSATALTANADSGYHLITPIGGTISPLSHLNYNYKYIIVDGNGNENFGFGHIFSSGVKLPKKSGDMVLLRMDDINEYAIIRIGTQNGIGPVSGQAKYDGVTYSISDNIAANSVIAPMGNSGETPAQTYLVHTHLYRPEKASVSPMNDNNAKNPLAIINHQHPVYQNTITQKNNIDEYGTTSQLHPGNLQGSLRVRCNMLNPGMNGETFSNAVMDIEEVCLFIKKSFLSDINYKLIKGKNFESKISLGGRINSPRYPSISHPESNLDIDIRSQIGSITRTGIDPHAYSGLSYDNYFFSDFYTRLRKGHILGQNMNLLAKCNEECEYPDGIYDIYARAENINGNFFPSTPQDENQIIIDNFLPYVQKVEIFYGYQIYSGSWSWNETSEQLIFNQLPTTIPGINTNNNHDLNIKVFFSEPMSSAFLSTVPSLYSTCTFLPVPNTGDQIWECTIPYSELYNAVEGQYLISIAGNDQAGNQLDGFDQLSPNTFSAIPIRQEGGVWYPPPTYGNDTKHQFEISKSTLTTIDFIASPTSGMSSLSVAFIAISTGESPVSWEWYFGDGNSMTTTSPTVIHSFYNGLTTGNMQYSVFLKVHYSNQPSKQVSKSNFITVFQNGNSYEANFSITQESNYTPSTVSFTNLSCGNISTFEWDFGDGSPPYFSTSNYSPPPHVYSHAGTYPVTLTVGGGYGYTSYTLPIYVYDYITNGIMVDFSWEPSPPLESSIIQFNDISTGAFFQYDYKWDFGDGTSISTNPNPEHVFACAGIYNVKLEIFDQTGILRGIKSHIVVILPLCVVPKQLEVNELQQWQDDMVSAFGCDVSASNNHVVVGSYGKIFIYKRSEDLFNQQKVFYPDEFSSYYGMAVGISNNVIVTSDYMADDAHGMVYTYKYDENIDLWTALIPLQSHNILNDEYFGRFLAVNGEDLIVIVYNANIQDQCRAYYYRLQGNQWQFIQNLGEFPDVVDHDNDLISISEEFLVVARRVFIKVNNEWSLVDNFPYTRGVGLSNYDVAMSTDYTCFSRIYRKSGNTFPLLQTILKDNNTVSLIDKYLALGFDFDNSNRGYVELYRKNMNNYYLPQVTLRPVNSFIDQHFGHSTAFSDDLLFVGAPGFGTGVPGGSVFYYKYATTPCDKNIKKCNHNYSSQLYDDINANTIILAGQNCGVNIPAGCIIKFGGNEITLGLGFTANYLSDFTAKGLDICHFPFDNKIGLNPESHPDVDSTFVKYSQAENSIWFYTFPNPTYDNITIKTKGHIITNSCIKVYSIEGKLVFLKDRVSFDSYTINLSSQPVGLYFIHLSNADHSVVFKVFKK